ncbi:MAG: enoyl-CoA hydratase [Deltaproteobacteria bacterium]|nr:enoyl-CoA hydratase [Deltaproteobacteria bacterium]
MGNEILIVEKSEGIATLTLNRPEARNALSRALREAIVEAFHGLRGDPEAGVVILTGAGKAFCAGLDLKELAQRKPEDAASLFGPMSVIQAMADFDRPIIGAVNGPAITGGFELALACDVLIASSTAGFADTHARVGALPGWGMSQKLSRAIGIYRAKELSLTGNVLSASQAEAWGLINRVVEPDLLMEACRQLARDMLSCVPEVLRAYKRVIDEGYARSLAQGLEVEMQAVRKATGSLSA